MKKYFTLSLIVIACITQLHSQLGNGFTKYKVNQIFINNNEVLTDARIKRELKLKERGLLGSTNFTERLIQLDKVAIRNLYLRHGYLACQIKESYKVLDDNQVDIFFDITEGEQFLLKGFEFSGQEIFTEEKINSVLDLEINEPYNPFKIKKSIRRLKDNYADNGKPLVEIIDSVSVSDGIYLFLQIREYQIMKIRRIIIKNYDLINRSFIAREILLNEGDTYSKELINKSRKHLFDTGYFSNININMTRIDTSAGLLDLEVYVYERKMHHLEMNFGFGQKQDITQTGEPYTAMSMTGEWVNRNIWGKGHKLSADLSPAINLNTLQPNLEADISYQIPWLMGFRSTNLFRIFMEQVRYSKDERLSVGGVETAVVKNPNKRLYFKTGLEIRRVFSRYSVIDIDQSRLQQETERAFNFQYRRDMRDDFLFPKSGYTYSFNGKIVGTILGGTQDYYKFETGFSQYIRLYKAIVLAYNLKGGRMAPFDNTRETPSYEKFKLGGASSMRGWDSRQFLAENGIAIGKNVKFLSNIELRFPLFWRIGGELFIDSGGLFSDINSIDTETIRFDAGFGLTIASPLGPARIDFARIIDPRTQEEKSKPWEVQFGIPYAF